MTGSAGIVPGARILASAARNAYPAVVVKAIDETEGTSLTASPPLVNDLELHLPVAAGTTYLFCCFLDYEGDSSGGGFGGVQYLWAVPSGATMRYTTLGAPFGGGTQVHATQQEKTQYQIGTNGAGVLFAALMLGTLVTSTASGTLQLTWNTYQDHLVNSTIHAQSFLALWQLSP